MSRLLFTLLLLSSCSDNSSVTDASVDSGIIDASVDATLPQETRYLAFQIFEGRESPAIPFDQVVQYTPRAAVSEVVGDIVTAIGLRGSEHTKLAFILGPISFDHTDSEARQIVADGFSIASEHDVAVGFHIDESMFWSLREDLTSNPENVEWTDWQGTPSSALALDWSNPPQRMCLNAPSIQAEVTRRARDVIGAEIAAQVAMLPEADRSRFAGVFAGWESHMGQDVVSAEWVGFHALSNRGFSPSSPPTNITVELREIVKEFMGLWTAGLVAANVDPSRIYTHVAFLSQARFDELKSDGMIPPSVTYEQIVNTARSSIDPVAAFVPNSRPGFSTYPSIGTFDQIYSLIESQGDTPWASAEGTNLILEGDMNSGITMLEYLDLGFGHGATVINIFGWGIGKGTGIENPFRTMAEAPDSITAYQQVLSRN